MIPHRSVRESVPLAPMTTYKVGGPATWFAEPEDLEDLRSLLSLVPTGVDVVVLGRGSNVVISDDGIEGLVVRLGRGFGGVEVQPSGSVVAGGGAPLPVVARAATAAARGGLEFYVGIPGSVGGAVRMNAGGHGSDTASVLESAMVLDLDGLGIEARTPGDLDLRYRHSNLDDRHIVVQATFRTHGVDRAEGERMLREITRWRKENQPGGTLNAGSVFKNPEDEPAGSIIDRVGLKGERLGPVAVSEIHANFLVATPEATAWDIFRFVHHIQRLVLDRAGVRLEPEIRFLGHFPEPDETGGGSR
jgi:UDP-N-acetylmuramate dehydrogenase